MQSWRNNPDSEACQAADRQARREAFALQMQAKQSETIPFLFPSAFPLRLEDCEDGWAICTRYDDTIGSRNNFAVCSGIQHEHEARHICRLLNEAEKLSRTPQPGAS